MSLSGATLPAHSGIFSAKMGETFLALSSTSRVIRNGLSRLRPGLTLWIKDGRGGAYILR